MDPHFVYHIQPTKCSPENDLVNKLQNHRKGKEMRFRKTLTHQMIPIHPKLVGCISIHPWNPSHSHLSLDAVRFVTMQDCPDELPLIRQLLTWHSASIEPFMHEPMHDHRDSICNRVKKEEDVFCVLRDHFQLYDVTEQLTKCQCDTYCHIFGDCCFDSNLRGEDELSMLPKSQEEMVPFMSEIATSLYCMNMELSNTYPRHGIGFYMVGDCPEHKRDTPLQAHCQLEIDGKNLTYIHFLPIEIHHVVYRNIFCARCFEADISQGKFWAIVFTAYKDYFICKQILVMMSENLALPLDLIKKYCGWTGFAGPVLSYNDKLNSMGPTRMGKYCLDKVTWLHADNPHTNTSDFSPQFLSTFDDHDACQAAFFNHSRPPFQSLDTLVFEKTYQGFRVIAGLTDICENCDAMTIVTLTTHISSIEQYITPLSSVSFTDGQLVAFFEGSFNCSSLVACTQLFKLLCQSVSLSVGPSVRPLVTLYFFAFFSIYSDLSEKIESKIQDFFKS